MVGRKLRLTLQEAPGVSVEPAPQMELVSMRNSAALVPLRLRLDKTRLAVPLLDTVTAAVALALPMKVEANVTDVGATAMAGAAETLGLARYAAISSAFWLLT